MGKFVKVYPHEYRRALGEMNSLQVSEAAGTIPGEVAAGIATHTK